MGLVLGPLKHFCLTSKWSMTVAGADVRGFPWGLPWLPRVLSPGTMSENY